MHLDNDESDYSMILISDLKKMNYTIESNSNDIWESLNKHCHNSFGYGDDVKNQSS